MITCVRIDLSWRIHFYSKGQWSISPSPLSLSQVEHSCLFVLPLFLDKKYSACIMTSQ